jgi:hypothetical protein
MRAALLMGLTAGEKISDNASLQRSPAHASGRAREPAHLLFDRICNNAGAISRSRIFPAKRVGEFYCTVTFSVYGRDIWFWLPYTVTGPWAP